MKKSKLFSVMCSSVLTATLFSDCIVPLNDRSSVRAEETSSATIAYEDDYCSGDINGDGVINIFDFSRLNRYLEGNLEFDADQLKAADFNYDRSVDEGDLADMSGFITMYSEMPVNYHRRRLILNAKNFFLKYGETTDIELSIKIPDDWEKNDITVTGDGEKIAVIPFSSLTEGEKSERDGYSYTEYTVSVPVPDQGDNDTRGFSVDLTVQMNGQESYPVMLNRAVKDAKERIEKSGELIGNVSEYADSLPEGSSKEDILSEMKKWIEANPDLEITSTSSDIIHFKTSYGINSFFEIEEEPEIEDVEAENEDVENEIEDNETEAVNSVFLDSPIEDISSFSPYNANNLYGYPTRDLDKLREIYLNTPKLNNSTINTLGLLDPDVLLYIPCDTNHAMKMAIRKYQKIGQELAKNLVYGECDEFIGSDYSNIESLKKWNQYGTVIFNTHGNVVDDGNNNQRTVYQIYEGKKESDVIAKAVEFHDSINEITEFDDTNHSYLTEDMAYGVYYYFHYDDLFDLRDGPTTLYVLIGSGVLMQILSDVEFPHTVFYFDVCFGLCDNIFNQFLIDHGAAAVIGYNKTVEVSHAVRITKSLFDFAADIYKRGNYKSFTLNTAVKNANNDFLSYLCDFYPSPITFMKNNKTALCLLTDHAFEANIYSQKDFCYWGIGNLKGTVVKYGDHGKMPFENATIYIYRYLNGKLVPQKGFYYQFAHELEFSTLKLNGEYDLEWGSYLIQIIEDKDITSDSQCSETFIRLDFAEPELDLGEIVIQNINDDDGSVIQNDELYGYIYTYYILLNGKTPSDAEIESWKYPIKNHFVTAASMAKSFYNDNIKYITNIDNRSWALIAYNVFVGKTPDDAKRKELDMIASSGQSHENIAKYIIESDDFKNRCNELNILPGEW